MWSYIKSREFWLTIVFLILFFVGSFLIFFFAFLPWYTRHNKHVEVPELEGVQLSEAAKRLEKAGLRYEVEDSVYKPKYGPMEVVTNDPPSGAEVKPKRTIHLTVNKGKPPMVKVPKLRQLSYYQAKLSLESWGLTMGQVKFVPYKFRGVVVMAKCDGEDVKEGDELPMGSQVDLYAGQGKGSFNIEIPDLVGMHYSSAISYMQEVGLNIGALKFDPGSKDSTGVVFRQNPKFYAEDSISQGSTMDLWIAGERPEEAIEQFLQGDDGDESNE